MNQWLLDLRGQRTQADVAKAVGITQQQYSYIENGHRLPSPRTAMRLGKFLGFDWTRFYTSQDSAPTENKGR